MLSDVCVILLDLLASVVLEAGPQEISSFAVSRNYSHPSHPAPKDQVQLLLSPLPAGFLLLPQLPFHKLWRCSTPSPAPHPANIMDIPQDIQKLMAVIPPSKFGSSKQNKTPQEASWDWAANVDPLSEPILSIHPSFSFYQILAEVFQSALKDSGDCQHICHC